MSYVEFIEISNNEVISENIINDLVNMDAAYDPHQLPDFSIGKTKTKLAEKKISIIEILLTTGNKNLFSSNNSATLLQVEKYGNFHTIDWLKDLSKDRFRHLWLQEEKRKGKFFEKFQAFHDAYSGWFCVLLVGISSGIIAGFIDIGCQWMSNLKGGVCKHAFWLNKEECCWSSSYSEFDKFNNIKCEQVSCFLLKKKDS